MIDQHLKLFESLNREKVDYLLIGGTLAIAYGVPRVTKDIDLFIRPTIENAERCLEALKNMGLGTISLTSAKEMISPPNSGTAVTTIWNSEQSLKFS